MIESKEKNTYWFGQDMGILRVLFMSVLFITKHLFGNYIKNVCFGDRMLI